MAEIPELRNLSPEQVVEAAIGVLASQLHIDDPALATQRLIELADLDPAKATAIETLARDAAQSDLNVLSELLSGALNHLADSDSSIRESIREAAEAAGEKQTVIGIDILAFGFLVLCGIL